ncbi:flagellar basal body rod protein FlgC [Gracilinema caldarium]|uniref:Uncharacterized protein n=1 Tax=Gracilinema caldarium (strain ATCC 51460 / DSM 7334 / H1) TaxID=744872 RepID=F8F303_GRAC1|nr:hypothetical protein [Gracilinema caldarium]AEJ19911.1 hypothetical protein Spica_1769 [Gracilinema caldarium DSM 7334]
MKRKQLFILVLSVLFISCTKMENDVILLVPYSQQEEIINYFNKASINVQVNNSLVIIHSPANNVLINLLDYQYANIYLNKSNLVNLTTTRTQDGTYYKRKYLEVLPNSKYRIQEDSSIPKKIYDPTHPDSIKEGKDKGYVYYPNINIEDENNKLKNNVFLYNSILEYLKSRNIPIVSIEIDQNSI